MLRLAQTCILPAALLIAASAALPAAAHDDVTISDGWMRFVVEDRPAAGYFVLTNGTEQSLTLTGASSEACGKTHLHQTMSEGGVMKMVMVEAIGIEPGQTVTFEPGGYHLMCMEPTEAARPGNTVTVTLILGDGHEITGELEVRDGTEVEPMSN